MRTLMKKTFSKFRDPCERVSDELWTGVIAESAVKNADIRANTKSVEDLIRQVSAKGAKFSLGENLLDIDYILPSKLKLWKPFSDLSGIEIDAWIVLAELPNYTSVGGIVYFYQNEYYPEDKMILKSRVGVALPREPKEIEEPFLVRRKDTGVLYINSGQLEVYDIGRKASEIIEEIRK